MAYYAGSAAEYDFDRFTTHERETQHSTSVKNAGAGAPGMKAARTAAAPVKKEQSGKKANHLKKVPPKSKKQKNTENLLSFRRSLALGLLAAVLLFGIGNQIAVGAEQYRLSRQIASLEARLEVEKSENIRLKSELNGITGIGKIDEYAEKVLGMVKAESYQVECIDLSEGDTVIFAHSKLF